MVTARLRAATGRLGVLREGGLVLGLFDNTEYSEEEVQLDTGDLLTLFTDGVTEAANEEEDFWGEERLADHLRRRHAESCRGIARGILQDVRDFSGSQGQTDDITIVLARWHG